MSPTIQTNVLKLDSSNKKDNGFISSKNLEIDSSRDRNLTEFGKATLIDRYLLLVKNFKTCF